MPRTLVLDTSQWYPLLLMRLTMLTHLNSLQYVLNQLFEIAVDCGYDFSAEN